MKIWFTAYLVLFGVTAMHVQSQPVVIAHRGNSSAAPENTVAAVKSAAALKPAPRYIEIDVHRSLDGVIVVSHDANTLKTTGVDALIREKPFAWLRTLDAGYKKMFGGRFANERMPRLEEVLDVVKELPIGIMIESKQLLLEDQVIDMLRERNEIKKHVFASFDELSVYRAKQIEPELKTLYLHGDFNPSTLWRAKDVQADIIGMQYKGIEPEEVEQIQQNGFQLWLWTINDESVMKHWIEANADGIITNYPEKALTLVKQ